jgi:hypothetical protein
VAIKDRSISPWGFVGLAGLVGALFLYTVGSGLLAPLWATAVLLVLWLVMFVLACRWFMPHPRRTAWLAVLAFVLWMASISAGGVFLDWTA